jgi:hypothetical protein
MAAPQSFGDFFTRAFEWISERVTATFTWLTQDRTSIREELIEREAELRRSGKVYGALGRATVGRGLHVVGDLLRGGGVSPETRMQIHDDFRERVSQLPAEDQAALREVRRLTAAGGFTEQEMREVQEQASARAKQPRSL